MHHKALVLTMLLMAMLLITGTSSLTVNAAETDAQETECEHSYTVTGTTDATFTKEGSKTYTCSVCGNSYTEKIAKTVPEMKKITANKSSVTISWKALSGAKGYAVFRKTGVSGSYKRIATTTSTSYKDKDSLSNGKKYYYTVRAYKGSKSKALAHTYSASYWSSKAEAVSFTYIKAPTVKKITNTTSGIKVSWKKVSGASGYAVLRKAKSGSYKLTGTTTKTSYTDKTAKAGTTYTYIVRAYRGSKSDAAANTWQAKYWSGYKTGTKARYLKTPGSLKVKTNTKNKRVLKWSSVKNATGYAVLRKKGKNGSWKMIGTTTEKTYTDTSASLINGQKYYYSVRAYRGKVSTANNNKYDSWYWSAYDSDGVKFTAKSSITTTSDEALAAGAVKETGKTSGGKLTSKKGIVYFNGHKETYYSQKALPGGKLKIPGRHVNSSDQTVRDEDDFICVASGKYNYGTIVETSLGLAKVYDNGCAKNTIDIYTNW